VGAGTNERGEEVGKKCGKVNIVLSVHMYVNGKMIPIETISGMGKRVIKKKGGGGKFKYGIFDIL
jgi:hypothetical protein